MVSSTPSCDTVSSMGHRPVHINRSTQRIAKAKWNSLVEPLEQWLCAIQSASGSLSDESTKALDRGMKRSITLRDLIIISLLGDDHCRELDWMRRIFDNPYASSSVQMIRSNLENAFAHADDPSIRSRCERGLAVLEQASLSLEESGGAALLAVITYIRWWMGDTSAYAWAQACLQRDSSCTLASIILSALEHDMFPSQSKV